MNTITVWQCDADGYLIGQTIADESPLEPGIFLIPKGATIDAPPHLLTGQRDWRRIDGQWVVVEARPAPRVLTAQEKLAQFLRDNPDVKELIDV